MKIILIGNYQPDKQESMRRFADMLYGGFKAQKLEVEIWLPAIVFGKIPASTLSGYGKWLGYIDKWILFPLILRRKASKKTYKSSNTRFHICDHSNAPYLAHLPKSITSITCHDVLAIRGALGYADAYCPASPFGKILQQWILKNLLQAQHLATVSQLTFDQLMDLATKKGTAQTNRNWKVIHNAFNHHFYLMENKERIALLQKIGIDTGTPFILHVGSSLARKNRRMLIDMVVKLGNAWTGNIVFAGQALNNELTQLAEQHGIAHRIVSVIKPDHPTLIALYSACAAFVFPSFSEGFGWPVIEAQACGAPVIAGNLPPFPEVSGGAALHADPHNPQSFANALISLQDNCVRKKVVQGGFENIEHFKPSKMIDSYIALMQIDTTTA